MDDTRGEAIKALGDLSDPSSSSELWRYSPIDRLDLSQLSTESRASKGVTAPDSLAELLASAMVFHTVNGSFQSESKQADGWSIRAQSEKAYGLGSIVSAGDLHSAVSLAYAPSPLVIALDRGVTLEQPIVILHQLDDQGTLALPRLAIELAGQACATVVEIFIGGGLSGASIPVTELSVAKAANLTHGSVQLLDGSATFMGRIGGVVGRDGNLSLFSASFGGSYARLRSDVALNEQGASSQVRSTYLGTGSQVHDLRTLQDHLAARTTSDMLCKGAVTGESSSVYTGMIRIANGAKRSEANQTNHNLVLDERAHADSVPNLDISENDVRCSHASTVGPIDEDQRYYLESHGIAPDDAERLIVRGFFADAMAAVPLPKLRNVLVNEAAARLDATRTKKTNS
ncbi:MAG: SufD family Fe-S cluster assembly protein [Actinobacteria bacterium]|nr:SufD family Fe-S cluster assembly protein [Actinomycetota bacterium]